MPFALLPQKSLRIKRYPARPITLVVPWQAGGPTDAMARLLAEKLTDQLHQPVLVTNRPGANGAVGARDVVAAAPDGYTLMLALPETSILNALTRNEPSYEPADLRCVAFMGDRPLALVAGPHLSALTPETFLHTASQRQRPLSVASWGVGSVAHAGIRAIERAANIELHVEQVPGTAAAAKSLLAGEVDLMFLGLPYARKYATEGKIHILGVTTADRWSEYSEMPTLREQGINVNFSLWYGVCASANVSPLICEELNKQINEVLRDHEVVRGLSEQGVMVSPRTCDEFEKLIEDERPRWSELLAKIDL